MSEDEDDPDEALLPGLLTGKVRRMPPVLSIRSSLPRIHLRKVFLSVLTVTILLILYYYFRGTNEEVKSFVQAKLKSPSFCSGPNVSSQTPGSKNYSMISMLKPSKTRSPGKVLIVPKTSYSRAYKAVSQILAAHRIGYKSTVAGKNLPDLIKVTKGLGKYGVIFFEDYRSYLDMDPWNRDLLDKYCNSFGVGIIAFIPSDEKHYVNTQFHDKSGKQSSLPTISTLAHLKAVEIQADSSILRLTKSGISAVEYDNSYWVAMSAAANSDNFEPVAMGHFQNSPSDLNVTQVPIVLLDKGKEDGIPKVLFGSGLSRHWLYRLLFLDALQYLSNGLITVPLIRHILVDIDDIFVGSNRLTVGDVRALIETQDTLEAIIPGFRYNLGFSGKTYKSGTEEENAGDELLFANRHKFWWFPHMWQHQQPHTFENTSNLVENMRLNKKFALDNDIPISNQYSVAPHHSGVYPVHEQLYEAWKQVWNIRVTSTEEYPHLRPAHVRQGFIHNDIQVLPRQTCGLFTKNLYYNEYPSGPQILEKSIQGGELFQTIVNNPVSIFMTHMPNYAFDRLAPYTFESVINMIKCWTNLDLRTKNPFELGELYFEMFPDEVSAIWGNPCDDRRHREIWSESKSCNRLPDFLVIGPQKTGTTALYSFLQIHPAIRSNFQSQESFEELQFFSNAKNYAKGIDWYMDFFPTRLPTASGSSIHLFEKSATYFDKDQVPSRAFRLLKKAKLIAIIISPAKRAYSWYQHMRAHNDPVALQYTFNEVVTAPINHSSRALKSLQARCLEPGKYASHLERWLQYYKSQNIYIVDGEELKYDPISVMNRLQHFLNIQPIVDYNEKLKFDKSKGFYCPIVDAASGKTKCLGKGKGRQYPPMSTESQKVLQKYYRLYNEHLLKLLTRLGYTIPDWLEDDLEDDVSPA